MCSRPSPLNPMRRMCQAAIPVQSIDMKLLIEKSYRQSHGANFFGCANQRRTSLIPIQMTYEAARPQPDECRRIRADRENAGDLDCCNVSFITNHYFDSAEEPPVLRAPGSGPRIELR